MNYKWPAVFGPLPGFSGLSLQGQAVSEDDQAPASTLVGHLVSIVGC